MLNHLFISQNQTADMLSDAHVGLLVHLTTFALLAGEQNIQRMNYLNASLIPGFEMEIF